MLMVSFAGRFTQVSVNVRAKLEHHTYVTYGTNGAQILLYSKQCNSQASVKSKSIDILSYIII